MHLCSWRRWPSEEEVLECPAVWCPLLPRAWRYRECFVYVLRVLCYWVLASFSFRPTVCRGSLPVVGSVRFPTGLWQALTRCVLFCSWNKSFCLQNWGVIKLTTLKGGVGGVYAGLLGDGAHSTGTEASVTRKGGPSQAWGPRLV